MCGLRWEGSKMAFVRIGSRVAWLVWNMVVEISGEKQNSITPFITSTFVRR
jgi:hypothetical protein